MDSLYQLLRKEVEDWEKNKHYKTQYSEIQEIFDFISGEGYLRKAQVEALQYYWYTRLVLETPTIQDIYQKYYKGRELLEALGIPYKDEEVMDVFYNNDGIDGIFSKIKDDDTFVKKFRLDGLRETLNLQYPSYILALAMGAGKTILVASIIATEFTLAMEYPDDNFVKNALVFAPGKTIFGALREVSFTPYDKILPARFYKRFITNVKFTYTRDNQKEIPVIDGSSYNIVVTNTEKIRLTRESITKGVLGSLFSNSQLEEAKELVANQRLQTLTRLPNLAIFSDEAHHTYGQKLGEDLKRVRQTIDYISEKTNLVVVVNTTGTPYYQGKVLRDVIYWYGLSQGIKDGILKDVRGNIVSYSEVSDEDFVRNVVEDFVKNYWDVSINDGEKAKFSIYFPQIKDIKTFKPIVEKTLVGLNKDPSSTVLEVHNDATADVVDLFDNRINDPSIPYRIFLLVNKGAEGWNCPSLFATALARELKGANNFCLQASTRCLRAVTFNDRKAKIYISEKNVGLLDRQLQETYGESLSDFNKQSQDTMPIKLVVQKAEIPPVLIRRKVLKIYPKDSKLQDINNIRFNIDNVNSKDKIKITFYGLSDLDVQGKVLMPINGDEIEIEEEFSDLYSLAITIADTYRMDSLTVLKKLKEQFQTDLISDSVAKKIIGAIEKFVSIYEEREEIVDQVLALIKPTGFEKDENGTLYSEIRINKTKVEDLILYCKKASNTEFGFHYTPYNFDSKPEREFYKQLLQILDENPDDIEDIFFTGGITSRNKTDFIFEYKGNDNRWHDYTPDFLIRKKDGRNIIVEIKGEPYKSEDIEKLMGEISDLDPQKTRYEILETERDTLKFGEFEKVRRFIYENSDS